MKIIGETVNDQAFYAFENILKENNLAFNDIIRVRMYLTNLEDFENANVVY